MIRRQEDEDSSTFNFRGTLTAHTVKHFATLLHCVQHTGAIGENQNSGLPAQKQVLK